MPDYIRALPDPDDLTTKRPQYVYESKTPCPIYSEKNLQGPCWHGPTCPGHGPDCDAGEMSKSVTCVLTTNTNESQLWCPECGECNLYTPLRKSFQAQGVVMATVWQDTDTPNLTTGRVETDARKMQQYLDQRSDEEGERLGMTVDFQMVDPTDKDALGLTDEGLDATHDRQVATGQKDSRGRILW